MSSAATPLPQTLRGTSTASYLMELSDETSRSESSASPGGGGGSLSGTAAKAGDFLEENTSCHLGASRKAAETSKLAFLRPSEVPGDDGEQFLS